MTIVIVINISITTITIDFVVIIILPSVAARSLLSTIFTISFISL